MMLDINEVKAGLTNLSDSIRIGALEIKYSKKENNYLVNILDNSVDYLIKYEELFNQNSTKLSSAAIIVSTLKEQGVRTHLRGFIFLTDAIKIILKDEMKIYNIIKLYECIAERNNTTSQRVGRAIKHSLDTANLKTTNGEFIADTYYSVKERIDLNAQ